MSLFATGLAVDKIVPVADAPASNSSKKRKRHSDAPADTSKSAQTAAAQVNVEKLMKKLEREEKKISKPAKPQDKQSQPGPKPAKDARASVRSIDKQSDTSAKQSDKLANGTKHSEKKPKQANSSKKTLQTPSEPKTPFQPSGADLVKREERKRKREAKAGKNDDDDDTNPKKQPKPEAPTVTTAPVGSAMTALQKNMQKKLGGARFRWINEQLYTTTGDKAHELVKDDPSVFDEYHAGFRSQAASWPAQPVQLFTSSFLSSKSRPVIADLGCGDATLARSLVPEGFTVLSYDLISTSSWVVEAQCTKHVPLPGDEAAVVDAVVCCLSLMGNDWPNMVAESARILKKGGMLKIAEVTSRFTDVPAFVGMIEGLGFKKTKQDDSNTHFILFDFVKVGTGSRPDALPASSAADLLKPCLYKKR